MKFDKDITNIKRVTFFFEAQCTSNFCAADLHLCNYVDSF